MIKRPRISKEELIADIVFLFVAMLISGIAIFIFDIHWSFYPGNEIIPPSKRVFTDLTPYYFGVPAGGIVGFVIIKLLAYAFLKEEEEHHEHKDKNSEKNNKNINKRKG